MQKLTCTLEFKEGRPVAKTVNELGTFPKRVGSGIENHLIQVRNVEKWYVAENSRREFEISDEMIRDFGLYHYQEIQRMTGTKFTATIENNLVTKIELL